MGTIELNKFIPKAIMLSNIIKVENILHTHPLDIANGTYTLFESNNKFVHYFDTDIDLENLTCSNDVQFCQFVFKDIKGIVPDYSISSHITFILDSIMDNISENPSVSLLGVQALALISSMVGMSRTNTVVYNKDIMYNDSIGVKPYVL